jgi:N-acetylmuramoyl-L-alanine amidase
MGRTGGLRVAAVLAVAGLTAAACGGGSPSAEPSSVASSGSPDAKSSGGTPPAAGPASGPTTTTPPGPVSWPAVPGGPAQAVMTGTGVVLPVLAALGGGSFSVTTPCGNTASVTGSPLAGATVVLDPGHGGNETGAVGPGGLQEKDVNLAVAKDLMTVLEAEGATVVLTRTGDYNVTLATRADIAKALHPVAFVSIHHNADPDGPTSGPGTETYYQIANPDSKRLAGLLWEEESKAFAAYDVAWVGDTDHGAKYRLNSAGDDYLGILRDSHGVDASLSEGLFISNPPEEKLLADLAVQQVEAGALARAIVRFATTRDPGSGFVTPYPRTTPAGGGGGTEGCTDPPL